MFRISSNSDSLHAYRLNKPNHKILSINPDDTYASTTFRDSMKCRQEFYYGSSYLSQSSCRFNDFTQHSNGCYLQFFREKRELNF